MPEVRVVPATQLAQAESVATRDIMLRRASGYLVIDAQTLTDASARYAGRRDDAKIDMLQVNDAIREGLIGLRLERHGLSSDQIDSMTIVSPTLHTEHIGDEGFNGTDEAQVLLVIFVGFLFYISIVMYGQSMLSGVIEEKATRMAEIVMSSVRPETLLAGKVLGISAVGLTQQLIWVGGAVLLVLARTSFFGSSPASAPMTAVFHAALGVSWWWLALLLVFFLLGFVFFGSLFAAGGCTVSNDSDARQAAQPIMLLLVASIVLLQPVISDPSGSLARTLSILPLSSPMLMPLRMAVSSVSPLDIAASIGVLLLSCGAAVWLSARIYRVGLLMYGKRPTFTELGRWIREG